MIPGRLHTKCRIRGDDGFVMAKYLYVAEPEPFVKILEMLKVQNPPQAHNCHDVKYVESRFKRYLRGFCADSFCLGNKAVYPTEDDGFKTKYEIYIGFRSKKDLFKFNMRFGAKRIKWWNSTTHFTVVATADDPYRKSVSGENWNREDPQGFIR